MSRDETKDVFLGLVPPQVPRTPDGRITSERNHDAPASEWLEEWEFEFHYPSERD
ncbi:MAG: hypothetical protein ACR2M0_00455 [Chloroflexia bacterium]